MTENKPIIHGEIVPVITLTRRQIEEDWYTLHQQLTRKTQECEQKDKDIKYSMKCLDNSFKRQQDSELYWEREKKKLKAEKEKLKQTLIEIQQDLEFATYCESQECGCDDANECLECTKNHILQKISECEVENAR